MAWSRPAVEQFKRLIPDFVWFVSSVAVLFILFLSHAAVSHWSFHHRAILWAVAGALAGAVLTAIAIYAQREHWAYRFFDPLPTDKKYLKLFIFGFFFAIVIANLDSPSDLAHVTSMLDHHGSLFDWVIGSLTVVGIWLTYNTITESQRIIRSFTQLQLRIVAMAEDTKDDDTMHFLAFTASLGFLALKPEEWTKVSKAFEGLERRLKIITLNENDLQEWHNQYIGRSTSRKGDAKKLGLLDALNATEASVRRTSGAESRFLMSEQMPGYYLIFNSRRAIIVNPFFIPQYPLAITDPIDGGTGNRVQMFGFETTDQRIIEDVSSLFEHHWRNGHERLSHFGSEGGAPTSCRDHLMKELDHVFTSKAKEDKYYRYRLLISEENVSWDVILGYLRDKFEKDGDLSKAQMVGECFKGSQQFVKDGTLSLVVESKNHKEWIESNCLDNIDAAKKALRLNLKIEISAKPSAAAGT